MELERRRDDYIKRDKGKAGSGRWRSEYGEEIVGGG